MEIDLILKGIKTGIKCLNVSMTKLVEIDLILKGIKTRQDALSPQALLDSVEIDLILKGIKTKEENPLKSATYYVEIDLILKGIKTIRLPIRITSQPLCGNRPDSQRD